MTDTRWPLSMLALYFVACATSAPPPPRASVPIPPTTTISTQSSRIDAEEYRRSLEEAYAHIVAREHVPVDAPTVDVEAAASIPIPEHRTINGALSYFSTELKDDIQASLIRSARYKNLIDQALEEQKLPKGLAYLPVIESAYMPTLTSRAGAHGIWQFMPDTAREYGLRVDWWVDERADPERSTRAAAAYLSDLHRQFDDWPLVLAAYNAGPGRVRRALEENGATTFWELLEMSALPKETRGYVPTFFATLIIASDPATYGFELGKPEDFDDKRVDVVGPLSLKYVAEVAGVDESVLRGMNPALRRGIVPPGRASLRVPSSAVATVAERARTLKNEDAYVAVCKFTLRRGDTLRRIARAVGAKPETILAMNDLKSEKRVGAGDSIYLPVRARELGARLRSFKDETKYYAVKKGDTLYSVAKRHGLSVAELREINDLSKQAKLRVGQRLRVSPPRALTAGGM